MTPQPLSKEQRELIERQLKRPHEDPVPIHFVDVEVFAPLLAAEAYWRGLIAKSSPWCDDYNLICDWCSGNKQHTEDCAWRLANQ